MDNLDNKFVIPEGSKVHFELHGVSSYDIIKTAEAYEDMEVLSNAILLIDDGLFCTDSINPVQKINDTEFKVIVWLQDAFIVKGDCFYSSLNDLD